MDNLIWVVIVAALFLFSLYRMKQEYRRGFQDGASRVLAEWKEVMGLKEGNDDNIR